MPRLIDADALRDDTFIFDAWDAKIVRAWLGDQPTVDAVEVVRCRDCKHYDKDTLWCNINSAQFTESHYNWYADDFCSYGAKMDGDGNG